MLYFSISESYFKIKSKKTILYYDYTIKYVKYYLFYKYMEKIDHTKNKIRM